MITVTIRVTPGAKKQRWQLDASGQIKCYLMARAVDGKANEALVAELANKLDLPKSAIQIISGHTGRIKRIQISSDLTQSRLLQKLGLVTDVDSQQSLV